MPGSDGSDIVSGTGSQPGEDEEQVCSKALWCSGVQEELSILDVLSSWSLEGGVKSCEPNYCILSCELWGPTLKDFKWGIDNQI